MDEGAGYPVIGYSEGLEIGYRWFQAQGIEPLFGFGFGRTDRPRGAGPVRIPQPASVRK